MYYDQVAQIVMPTWSSGRVVLVGDSCAAVSLLAAAKGPRWPSRGTLLAEQLEQLDQGAPLPALLTRYEETLKPIVARTQASARKATRWFIPSTRLGLQLRRAVLRLGRLPGLDQYVGRARPASPPHCPTPGPRGRNCRRAGLRKTAMAPRLKGIHQPRGNPDGSGGEHGRSGQSNEGHGHQRMMYLRFGALILTSAP